MKLAGSLIVYNEVSRYLTVTLPSLLELCDVVCVWDDGSTDGTSEWLREQEWVQPNLRVHFSKKHEMFEHEGQARQRLIDWTRSFNPTHIAAIDADEVVANPKKLKTQLKLSDDIYEVWNLEMNEVWSVDEDFIYTREDGGWRTHNVPIVWKVPHVYGNEWKIADRALACGRVPARAHALTPFSTNIQLLHLGWTNKSERLQRYERYVVADGGNFHAKTHLDSIVWPENLVLQARKQWPEALEPLKEEILRLATVKRGK